MDLLASKRMRQIVAEVAWRRKDRIVIFDAPPVLATSDSSVLASYVGQVAFVCGVLDDRNHEIIMVAVTSNALDHLGIGRRSGRARTQIKTDLQPGGPRFFAK